MVRLVKAISTVNKWCETETTNSKVALEWSFDEASLFNSIYIPVKTPTASGMPDEYTYTNIGMTSKEMVELYKTLYSQNYLVEQLVDNSDFYMQSVLKLKNRIKSIYLQNYGKYLKMIELSGYEYNPLFNVDGVEDFTYLENQGTNDTTTQRSYTTHTDNTTNGNVRTGGISESGSSTNSNTDTEQVTSFDSTNWNDTNKNSGSGTTSDSSTTTYNSLTDSGTGSVTYGAHTDTDSTTVTHHNALNGSAEYSGGNDVFGNTVTGGDKYHNERRVRKGNIGVTKTQELIESERANLRFSIIQEFFDDINKYILVGVYD